MNTELLIATGFALVLIGVLLIVAGSVLHADGEGNVEAGGVVFIGPIPIVFGSSKKVAGLSLLIGLTILIITLLLYRRV